MKYSKSTKSLDKHRSLQRTETVNSPQIGKIYWLKPQKLTDLNTYKKAEAIHATPQDLSTVLRWA